MIDWLFIIIALAFIGGIGWCAYDSYKSKDWSDFRTSIILCAVVVLFFAYMLVKEYM